MTSNNGTNVDKIETVVVLFSISTFLLIVTKSLWPIMPITYGLSILIVVFLDYRFGEFDIWSVVLFTLLSICFRLFTFDFPASLIGRDPDRYAMNIHLLTSSATLDSLSIYVYQNIPGFLLMGSIYQQMSGLDATSAMVVFPFIIGLSTPILVLALTRSIFSEPKIQLFSIFIGSISSISLWLSFWPIPQSLATIHWIAALLALFMILNRYSARKFVVFALVSLAAVYTHMLPTLFLVLIITLYLGISKIHTFGTISNHLMSNTSVLWIISLLLGVIIFIQWSVITNYIIPVVGKLSIALGTDQILIQPDRPTPSNAVQPYRGWAGILIRRGHAFVLLGLSGLGWLVTAKRRPKTSTQLFLLSATSLIVIIVATAVINPFVISPLRGLLLGESLFSILIAVLLFSVTQEQMSHDKIRKATVSLLIILLIGSQLVAPIVNPDHPASSRKYLDKEEVAGKEFGNVYATSPIITDGYLDSERISFEINSGYRATPAYRSDDEKFLNGVLFYGDHQYFLLRSQVKIYDLEGGIWSLTYSPRAELQMNNKIYSNDGTILYQR